MCIPRNVWWQSLSLQDTAPKKEGRTAPYFYFPLTFIFIYEVVGLEGRGPMREECTHSMEGKHTSQAKKPNFVSSNLCEVDSLLRKLCGCYEDFILILEGTVLYLLLWEVEPLHYQLLLVAKGAWPGSEEKNTHWMWKYAGIYCYFLAWGGSTIHGHHLSLLSVIYITPWLKTLPFEGLFHYSKRAAS